MILLASLAGGTILLYFGAEWLVRGSAALALRAGVSSLLVGLTIVAFGTSAPELVVSVRAGFDGLGNLAVGNVIGSNIFNIAVILGLSALIRPLKVNAQVLRFDIWILIIVSFLLLFLLGDNRVGRVDGIVLTAGIILYNVATVNMNRNVDRRGKGEGNTSGAAPARHSGKPLIVDIIYIVVGLIALVFGSKFFVTGAVGLARLFHISEAVIGLTVIAAGTSLPELATSVVAAFRKEEDIAIGNIVGSNIFNILGILGITGLLTPFTFPEIRVIDLGFMAGTALVLFPFMKTGYRISRIEGAFLLTIYMVYTGFLFRRG